MKCKKTVTWKVKYNTLTITSVPELVALVSSLTRVLGWGKGASTISVTQIEVVQLNQKTK